MEAGVVSGDRRVAGNKLLETVIFFFLSRVVILSEAKDLLPGEMKKSRSFASLRMTKFLG